MERGSSAVPNGIYKGIEVAEGKGDGLSNNGGFFW